MRSTSCTCNLTRCLHCVSCRHCCLRLCMCVSPLLPWVSCAAMLVTAATMGVNCGHGCCRRCRVCLLWPWVSPLQAVGVATATIHIICGCACCRRHHASCCGCAHCCCGPHVSPPLPCASSAAMLRLRDFLHIRTYAFTYHLRVTVQIQIPLPGVMCPCVT